MGREAITQFPDDPDFLRQLGESCARIGSLQLHLQAPEPARIARHDLAAGVSQAWPLVSSLLCDLARATARAGDGAQALALLGDLAHAHRPRLDDPDAASACSALRGRLLADPDFAALGTEALEGALGGEPGVDP